MEIAFLPQATEDLQYYSISSGRVYVYVISARFHYSK